MRISRESPAIVQKGRPLKLVAQLQGAFVKHVNTHPNPTRRVGLAQEGGNTHV